MKATSQEVWNHLEGTGFDPELGYAVMSCWGDLTWDCHSIWLESLPVRLDICPADVQTYAVRAEDPGGSDFPAIVVVATAGTLTVVDGQRRIAAARLLGRQQIVAFVGALDKGHLFQQAVLKD